jgi:hypothetical protein
MHRLRLLALKTPGEIREEQAQRSIWVPEYPWPNEGFVFLFFIIRPVSRAHLYLIPISPPDLRRQKRKRLESQNHSTLLRALWWDTSYACLLFPPNLKTSLHVADRFKNFHQPGGHYRDCEPSCSCYKSVMHLHHCSPSVFAVSSLPFQLIRPQCLLLPTRSFPGRPRTPVRASCSALGALSIVSR